MEPQWTGSKYTDARFLLGTDFLGRDILSRLIYASRISMVVGFLPTAIVFSLGVTVGMAAGFFGGWIDQLLMRFTDIVYAFPDFLFLLIIVASFRASPFGKILDGLLLIFVAIAIVGWVGIARLTRGQVLSLKEREFVEAASSIGATPVRRSERDPRRGDAVVPRRRHHPADAVVGSDDQRRLSTLLVESVVGGAARDLHLGRDAGVHLRR